MGQPRHWRALTSCHSAELARLSVDLEQTRAAIDLWQYAVQRIPAAGAVSTKLLDAIPPCVDGWLDLLRLCAAQGEDNRARAALARDAMHCSAWAEEARLALRLIADIRALDSEMAPQI